MAEIKSFPNNQDVYVGAEWVMKWLHGRTSGVFGAENNLSISIVPDSMSVEVSDGVGWLANANGDGIVFWNDSEQSNGSKLRLTHDVADGVLDRIDRIVVTWETTNYVALPTISILKGIASSMPIPPILTNSTTQRQISIASVKIPAGAISLSASMVTDERLNSDVCGIVTETIKVDTSTMQSQFEALLNAIQLELQNLNAGTATLLRTGGTMEGPIDMNGHVLKGLNAPTADDEAVNKGYVDNALVESEDHPGCYYRTVDGVTEWINPPMNPSQEYRTTERYYGNAVYKKVIPYKNSATIGSTSTTTNIAIPHGIDNLGAVVRCVCCAGNITLPTISDGRSTCVVSFDRTDITLRIVKDTWASRNWYFDIAYTKNT